MSHPLWYILNVTYIQECVSPKYLGNLYILTRYQLVLPQFIGFLNLLHDLLHVIPNYIQRISMQCSYILNQLQSSMILPSYQLFHDYNSLSYDRSILCGLSIVNTSIRFQIFSYIFSHLVTMLKLTSKTQSYTTIQVLLSEK